MKYVFDGLKTNKKKKILDCRPPPAYNRGELKPAWWNGRHIRLKI